MASNCSLFSFRSGLPSFSKENLIASWNKSSDLDAIFQTGSGLRSRDDNKNPVVGKRIIPEVPIPVADQKDRGIWERDWEHLSHLRLKFHEQKHHLVFRIFRCITDPNRNLLLL